MTAALSPPIRLSAPADAAAIRLDRWLAGAVPQLSRSRLQALIEEGRVSLDGAPARDPSAKVVPGGVYVIDLPPPAISASSMM